MPRLLADHCIPSPAFLLSVVGWNGSTTWGDWDMGISGAVAAPGGAYRHGQKRRNVDAIRRGWKLLAVAVAFVVPVAVGLSPVGSLTKAGATAVSVDCGINFVTAPASASAIVGGGGGTISCTGLPTVGLGAGGVVFDVGFPDGYSNVRVNVYSHNRWHGIDGGPNLPSSFTVSFPGTNDPSVCSWTTLDACSDNGTYVTYLVPLTGPVASACVGGAVGTCLSGVDTSGSTWDCASAATCGTAEQNLAWVALTAPPVATVTCGVTLNTSTGLAAFHGQVTPHVGSTEMSVAEGWVFGDGSTEVGSTPNVNHPYTLSSQPSGGWTATYTAVALGDGVAYSAVSVSSTCTATVDFVTGSVPTGAHPPSTATGGVVPPTSCGWTDMVCMIEQAVGWLVVPGSSTLNAWHGFLTTTETHVPFSYVVAGTTFVYNVGTAIYSMTTSSGSSTWCVAAGASAADRGCWTMPTTGLFGTVRWILGVAFTLLFLIALIGQARRVIRAH